MAISDPGRGLVRCLGVTAAAIFAFAAASTQRAEALSLASPGTAPSAKHAADGLTTEVRHGGGGHGGGFRGGGGGGFRGGGFHGGGFRGGGFHGGGRAFHGGGFRGGGIPGGGRAFHGGGFRGGGFAVHRGGFHSGRVFRGGGYRVAPGFYGRRYVGYRHAYHRPYFHQRRYFHRRAYFAPAYYGYPRYYGYRHRVCRVVWTHWGPRTICRVRPWHRHHYWRHRWHPVRYW